ncbi:MAG: N-acetylmuramoyl-L-alanine amidase [Hyphomicrobiaceae bacterium]
MQRLATIWRGRRELGHITGSSAGCAAALFGAAVLGFCFSGAQYALARDTGAGRLAVSDITATQEPGSSVTRIRIRMSRSAQIGIFTLSEPYRLVLDLPQADFRLQRDARRPMAGMVLDHRFGLLAPGKSRIILDLSRPFKLVDVRAETDALRRSLVQLDVAPVPRRAFRPQGVPPRTPRTNVFRSGIFEDAAMADRRPKSRKKRLVVIDPGHGGPDSGAVGHGDVYEKSLVLKVAHKLARNLRRTGQYRVILTRGSDVFVSLADRVEIAQRVKADLFISLHADAIPQRGFAKRVRGATVYTLSSRASDIEAAKFAAKENAADALAGMIVATGAGGGQIEEILFDLMRRETVTFSLKLREHLVRRLARSISMSRSPRRSAAFKVLRQPGTPSVLIELGYMSNPADVRQMSKSTWQSKAAEAISVAVSAYFDTRGNSAYTSMR